MTIPPAHHYPVPTGPIQEPPSGYQSRDVRYALLRHELETAGLDLGAYDTRMAEWMAGWDWSTVAVIASWVGRSAAASRGEVRVTASPSPTDVPLPMD